MKKLIILTLSVIGFLALNMSSVYADSSDIVTIPDSNLRKAIKLSLNLSEDSELTKEKLLQLTDLTSVDNNIQSLEGLENALNLRTLFLSKNSIKDITPLKPILLNWKNSNPNIITRSEFFIDLSDNKISSLDVFTDIPSLPGYTVFHVERNQITNFSPMAHFEDYTFYGSSPNDQTIVLPPIQLKAPNYSFEIPFLNTGFPKDNQVIEVSDNGTINNGIASWTNLIKEGSVSVSHYNNKPGPFEYKVTYIQPYTIENAKVTAKYVDEQGNPISDDSVSLGNVGDDYTTDQKNINGYTLKEVQGNKTGKFTDEDQTVTYVYTKNPVAGLAVTAKYVDEQGNPISDDSVSLGNVGDDYTTDQKDINGYTFKEVRGNKTGEFTNENQTVTYVYTKNPVAGLAVTAKYVDEQGNPISDDSVSLGNVGDDYTTDQKDINGYTFKEVRGNKTGKFTDENQTVTYIYQKNNDIPYNKEDSSNTDQKALPKTGENSSPVSEGMGMFSLALGLISLIKLKKKKHL
ncbi:MucBP domain-containing protein [Lactococcus carnosus]|uniref:MucBP domain-containing protein n=1 Tax=Pseudolactococcus carnosus TaxID=2749961 RepID=UPI001FB93916|nr:MucBP domain-containing protein [Lactococcus carnosus]MCJ1979577.1 LPXTG cell wall anchor domain-containing protein [Lactococcus carnosus]